jgi:hypothetical protein
MNTNIANNRLLAAIKQNLTEDISLLDSLTDMLHISKEAAYRRIRGNVQFTLDEAMLIADTLQLSLDRVLRPDTYQQLAFELRSQRFYFEEESFHEYKPLDEFLYSLRKIAKQPKSEFAITSNTFTLFPGHIFYQIFKYSTFKYMYENENTQELKPFKDITVPRSFFKLNRDVVLATMNIKETSYIFYSMLLDDFVGELKLFTEMNLMTKEDVELIKTDLNKYVDLLDKLTLNGCFDTGNKVNIYVSNVRFDTSYSYIVSDNYVLSMIGAFSVNHLTSSSEAALSKIKDRIQALKRVSYYISGSGEMKRIKFINEQRRIIDTL